MLQKIYKSSCPSAFFLTLFSLHWPHNNDTIKTTDIQRKKGELALKITTNWSKETYQSFLEEWKTSADEKYCQFHEKIVKPSAEKPVLGIRTPFIKQTAKEICKGNPEEFLSVCQPKSHEETLLYGYVLCQRKVTDFPAFLEEVDTYITYIDNWASCDCFCTVLKKPIKSFYQEFWEHIPTYLQSENPWAIRLGLVAMLHYLDETHLEAALKRCDEVKHEFYYVKMAQAWFVSTAFAKSPPLTKEYFSHHTLDSWTFQKALQKTCESYRVSEEDKAYIRMLKKEAASISG